MPNMGTKVVTSEVDAESWDLFKTACKVKGITLQRGLQLLLDQWLEQEGLKTPQLVEPAAKVQPLEEQAGPTPSRMSRTLDPARFIRG